MIYFTENEIDEFISEDSPYGDLTTTALSIGHIQGTISFTTRHRTMVCGTEEVLRIFNKLGIKSTKFIPSGTMLNKGDVIISGMGNGDALHTAWKSCGRILENASGIATRTKNMVDKARIINPIINIATTRKSFPGTKKLSSKAVVCGGGQLHRLGLSESILIFEEHIRFLGGTNEFIKKLSTIKQREPEKKIIAEAHNVEVGKSFIDVGIDVLQCDKFSTDMLLDIVAYASKSIQKVVVAAAGNITDINFEEVVSTGVDLIVTSHPYFGKPADIKVILDVL